ncbi:hypothetical protein C0J52_11555 [Blattella germanica]|nr:hypothetical protein C0J52_11555 [Blattella germanica]
MQRRSGLYIIGCWLVINCQDGRARHNENTLINCTSVRNIFVDYSDQRRLHFKKMRHILAQENGFVSLEYVHYASC